MPQTRTFFEVRGVHATLARVYPQCVSAWEAVG
jgi:hypothetical protein